MLNNIEKQIEELQSFLQNESVKKTIELLDSAIDKKSETIKIVKSWKVFPANREEIDKYIAKNKIKVKKKRRFGVITLTKLWKGGDKERDNWLKYNSTINNTIWLSENFNKKTEQQKLVSLSHEISHHILSNKIGMARYDAAYLASKWFRLMIELCCYKIQYENTDDKDIFISSLATKLINDYEINVVDYKTMIALIRESYT